MRLFLNFNEGVEGSANLKKLYKELNQEHFGGSLPTIPVKWSGRLKRAIGIAKCSYKGQKLQTGLTSRFSKYLDEIPIEVDIEINMKSLEIGISTMNDLTLDDTKAILLHEMVHIHLYVKRKLQDHHGSAEFQGWIKKLRGSTGLDIPFKESSFKSSPKLSAKEGLIMVIKELSGKYGLAGYTKPFMQKKWLLFSQTVARIIANSGKTAQADMYIVKHPVVNTVPMKRTHKGLSWMITDEETVNEIIKTGKHFFHADKGGAWLDHDKLKLDASLKRGEKLEFDGMGKWVNAKFSLK
jgi:hypothetical protein